MLPGKLDSLNEIAISRAVAALPKADLHLHQEVFPRLERILASREGRAPYAWRALAREVMENVPAGPDRLEAIYRRDHELGVDRSLDNDSNLFIGRVAAILEEQAWKAQSMSRFAAEPIGSLALPEFMGLFREAEKRVQLK